MTAPQLRAYQREAIDAVIAARRAGTRRMVVCLPTGAGKTVIFADVVARLRVKDRARTHGEALRLLVWESVTRR